MPTLGRPYIMSATNLSPCLGCDYCKDVSLVSFILPSPICHKSVCKFVIAIGIDRVWLLIGCVYPLLINMYVFRTELCWKMSFCFKSCYFETPVSGCSQSGLFLAHPTTNLFLDDKHC